MTLLRGSPAQEHSFMSMTIITVDSDHGAPGRDILRMCLALSSRPQSPARLHELVISKQGTFFCSPLSKEPMVRAAQNAMSPKGKPLACKGPGGAHPLPLLICPQAQAFFLGTEVPCASQNPPEAFCLIAYLTTPYGTKGNFCLLLCFYF